MRKSFLQATPTPWGNQRKSNNHRFRGFREQKRNSK